MRSYHCDHPGPLMVNKNEEKQRLKNPTEAQPDTEKQPASWVQKYLDLADLMIRRRKHKRDDDTKPKAA